MSENSNPLPTISAKNSARRIELRVVSDYEGALRDMGKGITQFCFLSPLTYILANKKYGAEVLVRTLIGRETDLPVCHDRKERQQDHLDVKDIQRHKFAFGKPALPLRLRSTENNAPERRDRSEKISSITNMSALMKKWSKGFMSGSFDAGGVNESTALQYKDKGIRVIQFSEDLPGFSICVTKTVPQNIRGRHGIGAHSIEGYVT